MGDSGVKFNLLIAYPYIQPATLKLLASLKNVRIFIDSGAFTAWKAGSKIDLDQYISFLKNLPFEPFGYFMLDEIGDPEKTKENFEYMLSKKLRPIPIFTRGESLKTLDDYYKHSDIVGIGGLVQTRGNKGFVKGIMDHVGKRKCHWLGFTNLSFIAAYSPLSCDSSSWSSSVRYGALSVTGRKLNEVRISKDDFKSRPSKEIFDLFKWYGEDIKLMTKKQEWSNSGRGDRCLERMAFKSVARKMIDIESAFDTKFFAAVSCEWQIKLLKSAFDYWSKK